MGTKVVIIGAGTPNIDYSHSGPSVTVIVDDTPYLINLGPDVVRKVVDAGLKCR